MSRKHRLGNWILIETGNISFRIKLRVNQSGMWIFHREILDRLNLTSDGMVFSEEVKIDSLRTRIFKAIEVSVKYREIVVEVTLQSWKGG